MRIIGKMNPTDIGAGTAQAVASDVVAAVDLGSNSFHMIVARLEHGELVVIDRLRESVRLGAGLDGRKNLTPLAQERALACLERFGERLRDLPRGSVRAVGTNALRLARNSGEFLRQAQHALGHRIEVIAGREEARLIYLGVAHGLAAGEESRLVVDIGGGSTEIITGRGFDTSHRESLHVGCVGLSNRHFADGRLKRKRFRASELDAELEVQPVSYMFRVTGWDRAIGCSGTIKAIAAIVRQQGWCEQGITPQALERLREAMLAAGHVDRLELAGLTADRRPILPGGFAVLWAVFDLLDIERMDVSEQALREGALYDLVGRIQHSDVRDRTVQSIVRRWAVDLEHADRVRETALMLLRQVAGAWQLNDPEHADMLGWAALLHEIGLLISHGQYHQHGGYVVGNADLSGFSRQEQAVLAALIRGHRRKFPVGVFAALPESTAESARRLCVLLRLATLLLRGRGETKLPEFIAVAEGPMVRLAFPDGWLHDHPLTTADLEQESGYLAEVVDFRFD
jgi:exopolyphosphatase/guanosine-5'-triphosphate,3'-diphosphate pyrophosphatase